MVNSSCFEVKEELKFGSEGNIRFCTETSCVKTKCKTSKQLILGLVYRLYGIIMAVKFNNYFNS